MAILAFFAGPIGRWLVMLALAAAAAATFGIHERSIGYREAVDAYAERDRKLEEAYLAVMAKRQAAFAALQTQVTQLTAKHELELKAKDQKRLADLENLKKEMPSYVSTKSAICPAVPLGYLLWRGNVAAYANGNDSRAPAPGTELADTPSRFSLTDVSRLDAGQASAFKACRDRVKGWEQYSADVDAWAVNVNKVLKGETP